SWWPDGKPLPGSANKGQPGPLHTCGSRDRQAEPFLFRFWEPYGIQGLGGASMSYRHYFNGQLNYSPDLPDRAAVLDGGNVLAGPQVTSDGLTGTGSFNLTVRCPFYLTGAMLQLDATCPAAGDAVEVEVNQKAGGWKKAFGQSEAGRKVYAVDL